MLGLNIVAVKRKPLFMKIISRGERFPLITMATILSTMISFSKILKCYGLLYFILVQNYGIIINLKNERRPNIW